MALTQEDKLEIMAMFQELIAGGTVVAPPPEPDPEPIVPIPQGPDKSGPLAAASVNMGEVYQYLWLVNDFSAERGNRFTRSNIYELMADVIDYGINSEADWVEGSVPSWRFTKEAFMTRASEISGDVMATEFPTFKSYKSSNGVDYGVTAHLFNMMTAVMRRLVGQFLAQSEDRNLGPNGELLTNGECVRLAYVALDAITDMKFVPATADSTFMKVRMECYNQYKAMGEGVFGPWSHPGGSTPWSWAGQ